MLSSLDSSQSNFFELRQKEKAYNRAREYEEMLNSSKAFQKHSHFSGIRSKSRVVRRAMQ